MFNTNWDPYDILQSLQVRSINHENTTNELTEHQRQQAKLLELMAEQVKYLTDAVTGLQQQNKILHHRLQRLEEPHD